MGLLNDEQIAMMCQYNKLIDPFVKNQEKGDINNPIISYGLSSYGYDIRLSGKKIVVATRKVETSFCHLVDNNTSNIINPKDKCWDNPTIIEVFENVKESTPIMIPPNSFALGESVERICMPRNLLGVCLGKSTYARCGIIVNVTPLEPEWEGIITIEISNTTPYPAIVFPGEGILQLLFFKADRVCRTSYADRKGKYQNQTGLTMPIV